MMLAEAAPTHLCLPMVEADLDAVLRLEESVYPQPWSRTNFTDSLASGYQADVLRDGAGVLLGYFLLMLILDEAHLLNLAVSAELQGQGLGRSLLDAVLARARDLAAASVLLEVRPSNQRALAIYRRYGFTEIGCRKGYYPAADGQREDAIVLRYTL